MVFQSGCIVILPPAMYERSNYSISSPMLDMAILFHFKHSSGYEMISCGFNLHFLDLNNFSCAYWFFSIFLCQVPVQVFLPYFLKLGFIFLLSIQDFFIFSEYAFFLRSMYCKYFLPFVACLFISLMVYLSWSFKFLWKPVYQFLHSLYIFCPKKSLIGSQG